MMAVTMPPSAVDLKNDQLSGAEENKFADSVRADSDRAQAPVHELPSPLRGGAGGGGRPQASAPGATPLPAPPPQGGSEQKQPRNQQFRRDKRDVHGWVILDKPIGMTSTHAVAVIKRLFSAKRAGHAGTLDPLASGGLPIALGEATKTVPFVMDGRKRYRFTVAWGEERDTDDTEGRITQISDLRPSADAIQALLPRFTGLIEQTPPQYSAIKIAGERAYDLARDGEVVPLQPRPVEIL